MIHKFGYLEFWQYFKCWQYSKLLNLWAISKFSKTELLAMAHAQLLGHHHKLSFWGPAKSLPSQNKFAFWLALMNDMWHDIYILLSVFPASLAIIEFSIGFETSQGLQMLSLSLFIQGSLWMFRLLFSIVRNVTSVSKVTSLWDYSLQLSLSLSFSLYLSLSLSF